MENHDINVVRMLGECTMHMGNDDESYDYFKQYLSAHGKDDTVIDQVFEIASRSRNDDDAVDIYGYLADEYDHYDSVLKLANMIDGPKAVKYLQICLGRASSWDELEDLSRKTHRIANEIDDDSLRVSMLELLYQKRYTAVLDDIGPCYESIHNYSKALYYYQLSDDSIALYNLVLIQFEWTDTKQAIDVYQDICRNVPESFFRLGCIYQHGTVCFSSNLQLAFKYFKRCFEDYDNTEALNNIFALGLECEDELENMDVALTYYKYSSAGGHKPSTLRMGRHKTQQKLNDEIEENNERIKQIKRRIEDFELEYHQTVRMKEVDLNYKFKDLSIEDTFNQRKHDRELEKMRTEADVHAYKTNVDDLSYERRAETDRRTLQHQSRIAELQKDNDAKREESKDIRTYMINEKERELTHLRTINLARENYTIDKKTKSDDFLYERKRHHLDRQRKKDDFGFEAKRHQWGVDDHKRTRSAVRDDFRMSKEAKFDDHRISRERKYDDHRISKESKYDDHAIHRDKHRMTREGKYDDHYIERAASMDNHRMGRENKYDDHYIERAASVSNHHMGRENKYDDHYIARDRHRMGRENKYDDHRIARDKHALRMGDDDDVEQLQIQDSPRQTEM